MYTESCSPSRVWRACVVLAAVVALVFLSIGAPSRATAAEDEPPATLGIVFVNGLGSSCPELMDPEVGCEETPDNNLSHFFNATQELGYRAFMIECDPKGQVSSSAIASKGSMARNGAALGVFLQRLKSEQGIERVCLVAHSMGGLVSRHFIELMYDPDDSSMPEVGKLITVGTPHSGWSPYGSALVDFVKGSRIFQMPSVYDELSPEYLETFNMFSAGNSQVPYAVIGSHVEDIDLTEAKKRTALLFDLAWYWDGMYLDTDGLVYEPSAMGYEILTSDLQPGASVFLGERAVTRYYATDKWHGLPDARQAAELGITAQSTLTFSDNVFSECVKPELDSLWEPGSGSGFDVISEPGVEVYPTLSGDRVIWMWFNESLPVLGNYELHVHDLSTGITGKYDTLTGQPPNGPLDVSGDWLVWQEHVDDDPEIVVGNLSSGERVVVSRLDGPDTVPAIDGDWVVWEHGYDDSIYARNLVTDELVLVAPEVIGQDRKDPDVSGDIVVWSTHDAILGYRLSTGETFTVCDAPYAQLEPSISGDTVVWRDGRDYVTNGSDIYGKHLGTGAEMAICTSLTDDTRPRVSGDLVVWSTRPQGGYSWQMDVWGYKLSTGIMFPIDESEGCQISPRVDAGRVVWEDRSAGEWDDHDIRFMTLE